MAPVISTENVIIIKLVSLVPGAWVSAAVGLIESGPFASSSGRKKFVKLPPSYPRHSGQLSCNP